MESIPHTEVSIPYGQNEQDTRPFFHENLNLLIIFNCITSFITLIFTILIIILFITKRRLRNCFTNLFFCLMISESCYSLSKFLSIIRLIFTAAGCANALCNIQAFAILYFELASFLWLVFIAHALSDLLLSYNVAINKRMKYQVLISFVVPLIVAIILQWRQSYNIFTEEKQNIVWCFITTLTRGADYPNGHAPGNNYVIVVFYIIYWIFIVVNLIIVVKLVRFINKNKELSKDQESINDLAERLMNFPIISIVCFLVATIQRLLELIWPNMDVSLFIFYIFHIFFINLKGIFYFWLGIEQGYKDELIALFTRKRIRISSIDNERLSANNIEGDS